jgi:hypothetical protein
MLRHVSMSSRVSVLALLAIVAGTLGALSGCTAPSEEDADNDEAEISSPAGAFGPALFRNDFYTYLKTEGHLSEDQVRQLVFMPTANVIDPKVTVRADRPLEAHDNAFRGIRPTDLYNAGLREPLLVKRHPTSPDLAGELRHRPVHIVIVPGIFGEFIPVSPFEEAFQIGGTAKLDFEAKVDALARSGDPAKKARVTVKQYSVAALGDVDKSLKDTLRVASIDNANGQPLVTITYLKPELGSL